MSDQHAIEDDTAEEAQAALRDGIERARELLCEAKLEIAQREAPPTKPGLLSN